MKGADSRQPAKDEVVVIGPLSDATRSDIARAAQAEVAPLPGADDAFVVKTKPGNPRALFQKVNEVVGDKLLVAPVLVDKDGERLFPTGDIQVRFKTPPTDQELADFAERLQVGTPKRNKWSPQQVAFAVRSDDARFLPEITDEMSAQSSVQSAWADVRGQYRRG